MWRKVSEVGARKGEMVRAVKDFAGCRTDVWYFLFIFVQRNRGLALSVLARCLLKIIYKVWDI